MNGPDQNPNANSNQQIIENSREPNRKHGYQDQAHYHYLITHLVSPNDHRIFPEEVQCQPQHEDQGEHDQRERRAKEGGGGAGGDHDGIVHAEVLGVKTGSGSGSGEGFRTVECSGGGEEFGPGTVARKEGGEVLE